MRQYSTTYSKAYQEKLNGMVERRMRQSIFAVACFWFTAWINAGEPNLKDLVNRSFSLADLQEFDDLDVKWKAGKVEGKDIEQ